MCACAGAKFFPGFLTDNRRAALDAAALEWQAEDKQQLNTLARVSLGQDQAVLLPLPAAAGKAAGKAAPAPQQQQPRLSLPGTRRHKTGGCSMDEVKKRRNVRKGGACIAEGG